MKKFIFVAVLISSLSACGSSPKEESQKNSTSTTVYESNRMTDVHALTNNQAPQFYSNTPYVSSDQIITDDVQKEKVCARVSLRKGKYFCTPVPYVASIPSPTFYDVPAEKEIECESINIAGTSNTCKPK